MDTNKKQLKQLKNLKQQRAAAIAAATARTKEKGSAWAATQPGFRVDHLANADAVAENVKRTKEKASAWAATQPRGKIYARRKIYEDKSGVLHLVKWKRSAWAAAPNTT